MQHAMVHAPVEERTTAVCTLRCKVYLITITPFESETRGCNTARINSTARMHHYDRYPHITPFEREIKSSFCASLRDVLPLTVRHTVQRQHEETGPCRLRLSVGVDASCAAQAASPSQGEIGGVGGETAQAHHQCVKHYHASPLQGDGEREVHQVMYIRQVVGMLEYSYIHHVGIQAWRHIPQTWVGRMDASLQALRVLEGVHFAFASQAVAAVAVAEVAAFAFDDERSDEGSVAVADAVGVGVWAAEAPNEEVKRR